MNAPVMAFESTVINRRRDMTLPVRDGVVALEGASGLLHAALLDTKLRWASYGIVGGLMDGLHGLVTTFTTAMAMLVLGREPEPMAVAASAVAAMGGGAAITEHGRIVWQRPLPILGLLQGAPSTNVPPSRPSWQSTPAATGTLTRHAVLPCVYEL